MNQQTNKFSTIDNRLHHLYISPLEQCNLQCKMCYTTKTKSKLSVAQILDFIHRYQQIEKVQTITFCGGEVFLLPDFSDMVNNLTDNGIFIQVITNGTIDKLEELRQPNRINLIVSIDGLPEYHNQNRGQNRWHQSITYLKKAIRLGFHTEVFSIVTKENIFKIDRFEKLLRDELGGPIAVTYHPRKPPEYLAKHPSSNQMGETTGFSFITKCERDELAQKHHIFPGPEFGCYQISVMSDGQVYGCCEGIHPLGGIATDIHNLIDTFIGRIDHTVECVEPDFMCGLKPTCSKGKPCRY